MKNIFLLAIVCLFGLKTSIAQNYQVVNSGRTAFFSDKNGSVKCYRIDSVKFQGDSILYPNYNITCIDFKYSRREYSPSLSSWIGKKVVIKNNKTNLIINQNGDTLTLKTNAKVGESWTFYKDKSGAIAYTATVLKTNTMKFLGLTDSVKYIEIKKTTQQSDTYDTDTLILSKNYGFVKTFPMCYFPSTRSDAINYWPPPMTIAGISNPKVGIQNFTWLEANDFNIGDEFHYLSEYRPRFCLDCIRTDDVWTKKVILDKKTTKDSLWYRIERTIENKNIISINPTIYKITNYTKDTITTVFKPDSLFDKLPGAPFMERNQLTTKTMYVSGTHISKSDLGDIFTKRDDGWGLVSTNFMVLSRGVIKGVGYTGYTSETFQSGSTDTKDELVYYKKGAQTWGAPLVITPLKNITEENSILLYPNPASDMVNVTVGKASVIELFDMRGKLLLKQNLESTTNRLNISNLKSGIYLYKIAETNGATKTGKLVKIGSR